VIAPDGASRSAKRTRLPHRRQLRAIAHGQCSGSASHGALWRLDHAGSRASPRRKACHSGAGTIRSAAVIRRLQNSVLSGCAFRPSRTPTRHLDLATDRAVIAVTV